MAVNVLEEEEKEEDEDDDKNDIDVVECIYILPLLIVIILNQSHPMHPHITPPHLPSFPLLISPTWKEEEE